MKCSPLATFRHVTVKCESETYLKSLIKIFYTCSKASLKTWTSLPDCFIDDQSSSWNFIHFSIRRNFSCTGDVMNPAAVRRLLQLRCCSFLPDPVVYCAEVRTVGWPESWSDEVWCFTRFSLALWQSIVLSAKVTSGLVTALTNVTETDIFCRRYLKTNNSIVNEYF